MGQKKNKVMVLMVSVILLFVNIHCTDKSFMASKDVALVSVDLADYGFADRMAKAEEFERNKNTSKIRVIQEKGSSVGSSMFVMMVFHEVAKARGYEYYTNLKEWNDEDGGRIYIAGFTNDKNADIKKEFGEEYEYENRFGQKRMFMSVSQLEELRDENKTSSPSLRL